MSPRSALGPTSTEFGESPGFQGKLQQAFDRMSAQPAPVVAAGLAGLSANKAIIIPGAINKVGAQSSRFLPRSLLRRIAGALK